MVTGTKGDLICVASEAGMDGWRACSISCQLREGPTRAMLAFRLKDRSPGVTMLVNNIPTVAALLTLPVRAVFSTGWRKEVLGEVSGSLSVL